MHKNSQNSVVFNTVPVTILPRTFSHDPLFLAHIIRWKPVALIYLPSPLSLDLLAPPWIFFRHAFFPWAPEGNRRWKILSLLLRLQLDLCPHVANLGIYFWLISTGLVELAYIYWLELYLRFLEWLIFYIWLKNLNLS